MHHLRNCVLFYFFALLLFFLPSHNSFVNAGTIYGTPGNDNITVPAGTIYEGIFGYEGDDFLFIESGARVASDDQLAAEAIATADAVAIDAGSGDDQVTNNGSIGSNAGADALPLDGSPSQAEANATGISAGEGIDLIQNSSMIEVTANATSTTDDFVLTAAGDSSIVAGTSAKANATGISAGTGSNTITNTDTITVTADAKANAAGLELQLVDKASVDGGVTAEAKAVGILSGDSDGNGSGDSDTIINRGTITIDARAEADSSEVRIQIWDMSVADSTSSAKAEAMGIKSGPGTNIIQNNGAILSTATAESDLWTVEVNITDWGLASSGLTVESKATGIEGNKGKDEITNTGTVTAEATSEADKVSINFTFVDFTVGPGFLGELLGSSAGSADTLSQATAVGISGEGGDDTISNTGTINASATATLDGTAVSIGAEGIPKSIIDVLQGRSLASSSPTAETSAFGIRGGDGQDTITNTGLIKVEASSTANDISVNLSLPLLEKIVPFPSPAFALGGAGVTALAEATGIEGGKGDDIIYQEGLIDVDATSKTLGVTASVAIQGVFDDISCFDVQASVADVSIKSESIAIGIDGGEGKDIITVTSTGTINTDATATADGITAAVGIQGKIKEALNVGASIARADTKAIAIATGIEGGKGDDTINNAGTVTATADSSALSVGVSVEAQLSVKKATSVSAAIADASTQAWATATGISGGEGADDITNSGKITVTATPEADSTSVSVDFQNVEKGLAVGISYADATTTADATAIGISGGAGNDIITNTNTGEITVTADSESTSASIGVTLTASFSQEWSAVIGGAITDGTTRAIANATGISGGEGDDMVTNSGKIVAKALPDADSASISVGLVGAGDGLTLGFTYADTTTTAEANAVGIDGGSGNDTLTNTSTGQIEVTADPTSSSASVGVTLTGVTKGTGIVGGAALTDGTTKAISNVAGMKGGDGDDTITNSGKITVKSNPDADSASVSVNLGAAMGELGLVGGFSYADATTTAEATAIGIDGGAGNDTITNAGEIEVTTGSTANSASIGVTAQGVKGMGAAVGVSLTDGTTKAISTATGIAGGEGDDTITNSGKITVKALPDADSASVSVTLSAAKEGVAAGGSFADATTTAQATATGIDGGEGNDTINNSGTIEVTADAESSSASVSVSAQGTMTGAALGVAISDGTTKAISNATGIKGGGGNDTITNSLLTTVTSIADIAGASVTVNLGGAQTGLVAGVAVADITTTADSVATGISGGSGDDTIENLALMTATATSTISSASVSVNAGVAVSGAAMGAALADGKTVATSSAIGLEGGAGNDTLTNRGSNRVSATSEVTAASVAVNLEGTKAGVAAGVSMVDGENRANALAIGISGGSGDDTIANTTGGFFPSTLVEATTASTRTNVSVTGNFSLYGAALGASFADATNIAAADARGIEGGEGDDKITNTSNLTAMATTTADTKSVAVGVNVAIFGAGVGASLASAETTGTALATGISGGEGNDEIKNMSSGVITGTSNATAKAKAISVDISYASFSTADATTTAIAGSSGMTGGNGQDLILNEGIINLDATSTGDGVAGTGTLTGYGAAKVDVNSWATTAGIDGGTEDDTIINRNEITALSNATAKGRSVSVNLLGAVFAEAGTNAHAITNGLSGGAGGDQVTNEGLMDLTATSNADLTAVSVTLLGYSNSDGSSLSEAIATGIDGGDGENTLTNTSAGSIKATATAYADTASVSVNLAGAVKADAGSTGSAVAIGIAGGKENDSIGNEGTVNLSSTSDTDASAVEVTLIGYGDSNAKAKSTSIVKGIDGGDGVNAITNSSSGTITGTATALADASSYDIQLSGGAKATAGTEATATAIGIAGGEDIDAILNEGTINLTTQSTLVSESRSYKLFGVGSADADSEARAIATGIDGGDGANTITNASTGSIAVSSNANATTTGVTANIGVAGASASTTSHAHSTGMKSGGGEDTIINEGILNVNATSSTYAGSGALSLFGLSFGDSLTEATTDGINAGGGNDTIINTGSITAGSVQDNNYPMAYSNVDSVSISFFDISSATFGSKARATAIIGGGGDDSILNAGVITVGDDDWMAKGRAYGFSGQFFDFFSLTSVGATAETVSTGIEGGDGNDTILNDGSGVLTVKATSYARTEGAADTTTFGSPAAFASSTTKATATGISGGEGNDLVENKGTIDVYAHTWADAYSDSWVGWGGPSSDSTADATATAAGINAGEGQNFVVNNGVINVKTLAETTPYAKADSNVDTTDAETKSYSKSTSFGILAADDGNIVGNADTGTITVTATARTYDAQGNISKAESDEEATVIAGFLNSPITASAVGISLGNGDDTVANDGVITVSALSDARGSAYSDSWPYDAQSDATAYAAATSKGIAVGVGANEIVNNGQMNVSAWSHANPITDSWSRDQTAIANATAGSNAVAIGIQADGNMINTSLGNIDVTARATTYADANTEAETTTATANLIATATGVATASDVIRAQPDLIQNDGIITVSALAGEDENGNPQTIALADTDVDVRSDRAEATGTSTVDAAGIRVGNNDAGIFNNGDIVATGRARAYLSADAFSRDYNPTANAHCNADSSTVGIQAKGGSNAIRNTSLIDVDALAEAKAQGWADSWSSRTYTNIYAGSIANATGISVGGGDNIIDNEDSATIGVNSVATVITYSTSDENANAFIGVDNNTVVASNGIGIQAGEGNNLITNDGQMTVGSTVATDSHASASSVTFTATATSKAGASADPTGIKVGDGNNTIENYGTLAVTASNTSTALSNYPSAHLDWALAYAGAGDTSITTHATGISAGGGVNVIENHHSIIVASAANADAQAYANTSTSTNHGEAYAGGVAGATGIAIGNGHNMIKNYGDMVVSATADAYALGHAEDYGYAYIGDESTPGVRGEATGISAGDGINEVSNYGTLEVNATATAYSKGRAHTTSVDAHGRATGNSYSAATGIVTGDGNNIVNNYGTIHVNAEASATAITDVYSTYNDEFRYSRSFADASAIGIQTGNGDDMIANYGTISTTNIRNGVSSLGVGITSGGGSDQLFLMDGSETNGHIDLGGGDDRLTFVGTPLVTGDVTGAGGIDTLVFEGAGSIGFTAMAFENAIKQGAGIYTVASLPTMQRIEVNQGTLQINSDYAMAKDSTFQAQVNGDGSHGQLKVNGTTTLDGGLKVVKGPGAYVDGTTYDILTGDAVNGWFMSESMPEPTPLLSFRANGYPDRVEVEPLVNSFTTVANNEVYRIIGQYMDRILPTASGDLSYVLGEFQNLSGREFNTAFSSLSPDSYDDATRITYEIIGQYTKTLQQRMRNRRFSLGSGGAVPRAKSDDKPLILAYNGSATSIGGLLSARQMAEEQNRYGLWLQGFGQWGNQDEDGGYTGFDYQMAGIAFGFDSILTDSVITGISVSYADTDIDLGHNAGYGDIESFGGSLYGCYFTKHAYLEGVFSYGKQQYDNVRNLLVGSLIRTAWSDHDGDAFSAFTEGGYNLDLKGWTVTPFGSLQYIYLDEKSFVESGGGGVGLLVDGRATDSLVSELGVRLGRVFQTPTFSLVPEVSLAWKYDFDIDDRNITSSFAGSPGAAFTIPGQEVDEHGVSIGASLTFNHKSGFSTSLEYNGELRSDYSAHEIIGRIGYVW